MRVYIDFQQHVSLPFGAVKIHRFDPLLGIFSGRKVNLARLGIKI